MMLYANNAQPIICSVRAFLRMIALYKNDVDVLDPLFLFVDNITGRVDFKKRLVFSFYLYLFFLITNLFHFFRLLLS